MCNNAEWTVKKNKVVSLDFCGTKMYSNLTCANKIVPIVEAIMLDNWCRKNLYKSLKTSLSTWLITNELDSEKTETE